MKKSTLRMRVMPVGHIATWVSESRCLGGCLLLLLGATLNYTRPASARTLGMVVDGYPDRIGVTVFDADTDTAVGSLPLAFGDTLDCSINKEQTRGYVTDGISKVWVIDLTTNPPSLASGSNPIAISNNGEDTALTPDGRFLLVCGNPYYGVAVIDTAAQSQVGTSSTACSGVDVCRDGSVLTVERGQYFWDSLLRRFTIDASGTLADTGEVLQVPSPYYGGPINVFCAPDSQSAIVVNDFSEGIVSVRIPGLTVVDSRGLPGSGTSGTTNARGDRVFVRTSPNWDQLSFASGGTVDVFGLASSSAALSAAPLFSITGLYGALTYYGVDQLALHQNDSKLYVPDMGANMVRVYNANTGLPLPPISDAGISRPTGICLPAASCNSDGVIDPGEACDDGNHIDGDGCSATCQVEPCHTCTGQPSTCSAVAAGTACLDHGSPCTFDLCDAGGTCTHPGAAELSGRACLDDGNPCSQDLCDGGGACTHPPVTDGTPCFGTNQNNCLNTCNAGACAPDVVPNCCGNGILDPNELCDDGNQVGNDLCSPTCTFALDHFACYRSRAIQPQATIKPFQWGDRFGELNVKLGPPRTICNPVNKDGEDPTVASHAAHLESYVLKSFTRHPKFTPLRNQEVTNEFGTISVDVMRPVRQLVPTAKQLDSPPPALSAPGIDHFMCYQVKRSKRTAAFVPRQVTLEDEFGSATVDVQQPTALCVPPDVTWTTTARMPYLVCYRITRRFSSIGRVFTNNELGPGQLYPMSRDELCVPSLEIAAQ